MSKTNSRQRFRNGNAGPYKSWPVEVAQKSSGRLQPVGILDRQARLLERGLFDVMFIVDVGRDYTTYGGSREYAVRAGMQIQNLDPTLIVSAMTAVTENLGFDGLYLGSGWNLEAA